MPGTTLDAEWQLLLAACAGSQADPASAENPALLHSLLQQPIHWDSLFALADHHGVQPLLFQALQTVREAVPPAAMQALEQSYQTNLHKSLLLARELIRIVDHLSSLGIEVMPYKGLALAELLYHDIALRQPGDIDLLVHANNFPRARDAVGELGYIPQTHLSQAEERAYLKSGYECAFDGTAGRNLLEIQWAIVPRFYAVDFDMNGVFHRAVTINVTGRPMKTPHPADLLLILAVHAAKHAWARLIWLCDLARLASVPNLPWDSITVQASNLGITRILCVSLLLAKKLLGAGIPNAVNALLASDLGGRPLAEEIATRIIRGDTADVESLAYFQLMLRLRERPVDRIRFLERLIFTPGPGEWNAVRLPQPLFPLYRFVRFSRLAARLLRA